MSKIYNLAFQQTDQQFTQSLEPCCLQVLQNTKAFQQNDREWLKDTVRSLASLRLSRAMSSPEQYASKQLDMLLRR